MGTLIRMVLPVLLLLAALPLPGEGYRIGILRYEGGDWYSCIPSVKTFLAEIRTRFGLEIALESGGLTPDAPGFFHMPLYILNGHGKVLLTERQRAGLRRYLENGGFLFVNDDYGMDASFRELIRLTFPDKQLVKLPADHSVYRVHFFLGKGLPKIHKHDGKAPAGYGLYHQGRLVLFYAHEADVIDGWDEQSVHNNPESVREIAFRMGFNILYHALTR